MHGRGLLQRVSRLATPGAVEAHAITASGLLFAAITEAAVCLWMRQANQLRRDVGIPAVGFDVGLVLRTSLWARFHLHGGLHVPRGESEHRLAFARVCGPDIDGLHPANFLVSVRSSRILFCCWLCSSLRRCGWGLVLIQPINGVLLLP